MPTRSRLALIFGTFVCMSAFPLPQAHFFDHAFVSFPSCVHNYAVKVVGSCTMQVYGITCTFLFCSGRDLCGRYRCIQIL